MIQPRGGSSSCGEGLYVMQNSFSAEREELKAKLAVLAATPSAAQEKLRKILAIGMNSQVRPALMDVVRSERSPEQQTLIKRLNTMEVHHGNS